MVEAGHTPLDGTEIMQVPIETSSGTVMTNAIVVDNEAEASYYGVLDSPQAPETENVIVCSTLDGECEEVMVEAGHTPLSGTEIMQVPIETAEGTVLANAIVVDNEAEANYYGVLDAPSAPAVEEEY